MASVDLKAQAFAAALAVCVLAERARPEPSPPGQTQTQTQAPRPPADGHGAPAVSGACDLQLLDLLHRARVLPTAAALAALARSAAEIALLCTWSTPLRVQATEDAEISRQAVMAVYSALVGVSFGPRSLGRGRGRAAVLPLLLASNPVAVQSALGALAGDQCSVMAAQPLDEWLVWADAAALAAAGPADIVHGSGGEASSVVVTIAAPPLHALADAPPTGNAFQSLHGASVGWLLWLLAHATGACETFLVTYTAAGAAVDGESKTAVREGEKRQVALCEAVETLQHACMSAAGASAVAAVAPLCAHELLSLAAPAAVQAGPLAPLPGTGTAPSSACSSAAASAAHVVLSSALWDGSATAHAHWTATPALLQVRVWPAWKCVSRVVGPSHPGTPTPSCPPPCCSNASHSRKPSSPRCR